MGTPVYCPDCKELAGYYEDFITNREAIVCPYCNKVLMEPVE